MTEVPIANKKMFNVIFEDIKNNLLKKKNILYFFISQVKTHLIAVYGNQILWGDIFD